VIIKKLKALKQTKLWATTINVLVIVVLINILANFSSFNLDLTADKSHSLSKETKDIIKNLDDLVTIKVFISGNLPPQLIPAKETLKNTLDQYQRLARGNIKVYWLDPQKDESLKQEANSLGIAPMQFSVVKQDQFEMVQSYFGMVVSYAGEDEVIPALQEINNLEYNLSSKLQKIQKDQLPTIGIYQTNPTDKPTSLLQRLLADSYQVTSITLDEDGQTSINFDSLIVIAPNSPATDQQVKFINQAIADQKGVLILIDKLTVNEAMQGQLVDTNLEDLIANYDIKINPQLIADPSSSFVTFRTNLGNFMMPYPLWVKTLPENANPNSPITASLESVVFPWVANLELSGNAESLWQSSKESIIYKNVFNISPDQKWGFEDKDSSDQYTLAAINLGPAKDFITGKQIESIKLAVVADSDFITDQVLASNSENANFALNLMDFLTADTSLINIRSKTVSSRPLKMIKDSQKQMIKIISLAAGPSLLLATAVIIRILRKKAHEKRNN